jgi:Helix-turn-helix domain
MASASGATQRRTNFFGRHLVHDELSRSGEDADVTTVALRHGFTHMGRFSGYYQSAFGELPGTTLRRRRPPHRQAKVTA